MDKNFRREIDSQLAKFEDVEESIENLIKSYYEYKEIGGKITFTIYTSKFGACTTTLTQELTKDFIEIIIERYKREMADVNAKINTYFFDKISETYRIKTDEEVS